MNVVLIKMVVMTMVLVQLDEANSAVRSVAKLVVAAAVVVLVGAADHLWLAHGRNVAVGLASGHRCLLLLASIVVSRILLATCGQCQLLVLLACGRLV